MAKTTPEPETHQADKAEPTGKERSPLSAFAHHQLNALEETGKAFAALLPKDFRDHAGSAIKETRNSWGALVDGVVDTVEGGLDKLRSKPKTGKDADEGGKDKVKVDVE
ncbi:MAG: hypothetical protein JXQ72_03135 [Anaerolineae bacterium]|nr:hypothetical protein [Anaerolineae bacterium]